MIRQTFVAVIAAAALSACAGAPASQQTAMLQVSYPDDAQMDCEAIKTEMTRMETIMAQSNQAKANAQTSGQVASTAAGAATNAALYSGALSRVPGLGLFANAASGLAQAGANQTAAQREQEAKTAEMRRTSLNGLYVGKGCQSPS